MATRLPVSDEQLDAKRRELGDKAMETLRRRGMSEAEIAKGIADAAKRKRRK